VESDEQPKSNKSECRSEMNLSAVIVAEIQLSGPFKSFTPLNLEIIQLRHDSDRETDLSAGIVADLTGCRLKKS